MEGFTRETSDVSLNKTQEIISNSELLSYDRESAWKDANVQADIFLAEVSADNFNERKDIIKGIMNKLANEGNHNRFVVEVIARRLLLEEFEYNNRRLISKFN